MVGYFTYYDGLQASSECRELGRSSSVVELIPAGGVFFVTSQAPPPQAPIASAAVAIPRPEPIHLWVADLWPWLVPFAPVLFYLLVYLGAWFRWLPRETAEAIRSYVALIGP